MSQAEPLVLTGWGEGQGGRPSLQDPEVRRALAAPFPARRVLWRTGAFSRDRTKALMLAYVDARTVMERLDEVCPGDWEFDVELLPGAGLCARGRLTVLGRTRSDLGEAGEGEAATAKAAASDALKRCAVHFGIGRYLYDLPRAWADWDEARKAPLTPPHLPQWALPPEEQSSGAAHVLGALATLRAELPSDLAAQREVYRHLRSALAAAGVGEEGQGS